MSVRIRRTLVDDSPPRRSPRLSSKDVASRSLTQNTPPKKRVPTPPRVKKSNIIIPPPEPPAKVVAEFSEDESEPMHDFDRPAGYDGLFANAGLSIRHWQNRLWESLLNAKDKGRKQPLEPDEDSSSKKNLFALFVLIPLLLLLISSLIWSMYHGLNLNEGVLGWPINLIHSIFIYFSGLFSSRPSVILNGQQALDVDLLIDHILANDKFNELIASNDQEKLMGFAKSRLEVMESELRASNELLFKEMSAKIDSAKVKVEDLNQAESGHNLDALKIELEKLKSVIADSSKGGNNDGIIALQSKVDELMKKHDDLAIKLSNCKNDVPTREQLEQDLAFALKEALMTHNNDLITKEELASRLAEAQKSLKFGLESDVLEKVRNDPVIMEKMTTLAFKSGVQQFSKDDVVSIVHEALTVYDADKTGLFDFALESAGGTIASIRCTETYDVTRAVYHVMGFPIWWERQNPRTILQPGSSPGQCWAFKGNQGCVVVKLSNPVVISGVTLEHIPKSLSPDGNVASAPKNFEVLGLESIEDANPAVLGNFTYDTSDNPVQTFTLINPIEKPFPYVELKVLSNYGNPEYTCIYRFRVHGKIGDEK